MALKGIRVLSHATGYPARSRDRSCDRHTVTATRSPPHGHRHMVTATRPSHPWPGHVPGHIPGHVISHMLSYIDTFNHRNLPGPLALRHSRRPLALWHPRPLLPFGPWPLFSRGQHLSLTLADGGLYLSAAFSAMAPLALGGLQLTAAFSPWGTLGHNKASSLGITA